MSDLIAQRSAAPTRKVAAVGISGIAVPPVAAFIVSQVPGISEACGGEVAAGLITLVIGYGQAVVQFASGYLTRERA
jgi:hypothetical protein